MPPPYYYYITYSNSQLLYTFLSRCRVMGKNNVRAEVFGQRQLAIFSYTAKMNWFTIPELLTPFRTLTEAPDFLFF